MGQFVEQAVVAALDESLDALGLRAETTVRDRLGDFAVELVHWSRRVDLTGAKTAAELVRGPLFGALTLVPVLDDAPSLVDVGSGGGLPGVPAALLVPGLRVTLVEPRARRTAFLRHAGHALGLQLEVVQCRVEELRDHQWSGAVSQAVWPAAEWLQHAARLVEPGGAVYVLSTSEVEPDALPPDAAIELARDFTRPHDGATLWATRVRCARTESSNV